MAKILYICPSHIKSLINGPFHEQLIHALVKAGNKVLLMKINDFTQYSLRSNKLLSIINEKKLTSTIQNFGPDIVFSFNHSMYYPILKKLDCPILVFGADSPPTWIDPNIIKKNKNRYKALHFSESTIASAQSMGITNNEVIGYASDMTSEQIPKKHNISFIGTKFRSDSVQLFLRKHRHDMKILKQLYIKLKTIKSNPLEKITFQNLNHLDLLSALSEEKRNFILNSISDLGLGLYGDRDWITNSNHSLDIMNSYNNSTIFTCKGNQDLYNSSKLSINISHAQSDTENMPFRVCDIMSTTAVLISDEKKIYDRLFGKYVKIPTFSNKFEARELCIKLLKDKEWRDDLVKGSNEAIQNGEFRFHHMIKKLESISGILLTPDTEGAFDFINPKNVMNHLSLNLLVESNVLFLFQCSATLLPNSIVERIANIAKTNPLRKHIPNVIIEHYKKHFKEYD